jgi:hypothetical protein
MAGVDQRPDLGRIVQRVADLQPPDPFDQPGVKFIGDALLHQQPAGGGAAFAVQRIDHEDHGIQRAVQVGILEHDHRVLAAQFEMHPLQRVGALLHDHAAGAAFADKGNRLDRRMFGQRAARALSHTVHQVQHAGRQPRLMADLGQQAADSGLNSAGL